MRCRIPRGYCYLGKVRRLIDFTAHQVERVFIAMVILASVKIIRLLILHDHVLVDYVLVVENLFVIDRIIIAIVLLIYLLLVPKISGHVLDVPRYQPIFELFHKFLVLPLLKLLKVLIIFLVQCAAHTSRCWPTKHLWLRRATPVCEDRTVVKVDAVPRCCILVGKVHDGAIFQQLILLHTLVGP